VPTILGSPYRDRGLRDCPFPCLIVRRVAPPVSHGYNESVKTPRVTVTQLVVLVAVVAVNLVVGRDIFARDVEAFYFSALTAVVIQFGVYNVVRGRGQGRMFWAGFVVGGSLALTSVFWILRYGNHAPETTTLGRILWNCWAGYLTLVHFALSRLPFALKPDMPPHGIASAVMTSVVFFLPLLSVALAFGLLCRQLAKWLGVRPVREGLTAPDEVQP
jgi:hypothetical protein